MKIMRFHGLLHVAFLLKQHPLILTVFGAAASVCSLIDAVLHFHAACGTYIKLVSVCAPVHICHFVVKLVFTMLLKVIP